MFGIGAGSSFCLFKSLSGVSFGCKCKKRGDLLNRPRPSKLTSWYSWVNRTKEITKFRPYTAYYSPYMWWDEEIVRGTQPQFSGKYLVSVYFEIATFLQLMNVLWIVILALLCIFICCAFAEGSWWTLNSYAYKRLRCLVSAAGASFYLSKSLFNVSHVSFSCKCKKRWDLKNWLRPSKIISWYI